MHRNRVCMRLLRRRLVHPSTAAPSASLKKRAVSPLRLQLAGRTSISGVRPNQVGLSQIKAGQNSEISLTGGMNIAMKEPGSVWALHDSKFCTLKNFRLPMLQK